MMVLGFTKPTLNTDLLVYSIFQGKFCPSYSFFNKGLSYICISTCSCSLFSLIILQPKKTLHVMYIEKYKYACNVFISVLISFATNSISLYAITPKCLFHVKLRFMKTPSILIVSDDFIYFIVHLWIFISILILTVISLPCTRFYCHT